MATLAELYELGVEANERFVKEMREIDYYFVNGRLKEWIAKQIPEAVNGDSNGTNPATQ